MKHNASLYKVTFTDGTSLHLAVHGGFGTAQCAATENGRYARSVEYLGEVHLSAELVEDIIVAEASAANRRAHGH